MAYDYDPELAPWAAKFPAVDYRDLDAARTLLRAATDNAPAYEPELPVRVTDRTVPGPPGAPAVPVRLYRPAGRTGPLPALLYLRWGGFVFGGLDSIHSTALRLADRVGALVVSVGYRNAPEDPYPAALLDCYAALEWTARNAPELGVAPDRVGVGGESAGAGLAAALTLLARDRGGPRLSFQCLFQPELDDRLDTPSARSFTDTPKLDRAGARSTWRYYLTGTAEPGTGAVPALAAPARADDLRGLPPAFVMICEFDPLRDEGIGYAHRLIQAGVRTELRHYPGTFHGSVAIDAEISRRMIADQVHALRQGLRA
ncbi:alpha/beta hydrolase [Streptomyces sp. NPDC048362]|uniref:alpha/beta hydrolase n=1 Tax=Streptomyces sp. NPDC048362 TaxID=3365539 RepID=UPI00371E5C2A